MRVHSKDGNLELQRRNFWKLASALTLTLAADTVWAQTNQAEVHWLGQSATKITSLGGKVIMIDPFSDAGPGLGAARQGRALRQGGTVTPVGPQIKITQTHAEHTSEITVIDPVTKKSTTYPAGEPTGFLIELENGFKIYHMGDTRLFGDMKLIGEYYKPDLIMIPHADAA